jgi:hypothetical protein
MVRQAGSGLSEIGGSMALFTDGSISTIADLLGYESAILDVAKTEGIDLTTKLRLAGEELAVEFAAFLARDHSGRRLDQIVVTEALHKWHTFLALALTYRDAYNRQLNDRYEGKWKEYEKRAVWAAAALYQAGVGIVSDPMERAEAPEISMAPSTLAGATYFVSVTWTGRGDAEGAPSEVAGFSAPDGSALVVRAIDPPSNATGWNVYAGLTANDLRLQNASPIALNQVWTEPASGLTQGRAAGQGQQPETFVRDSAQRVFDRG